jgi:hypothetical protein
VDDRITKLLNELGEAINRAVSESPDVDSVMQAIRKAGYEPWLLLEAKVAVENKRADTEPAVDSNQTLFSDQPDEDRDSGGDLDDSLTAEDRRFLKYLKIDY